MRYLDHVYTKAQSLFVWNSSLTEPPILSGNPSTRYFLVLGMCRAEYLLGRSLEFQALKEYFQVSFQWLGLFLSSHPQTLLKNRSDLI